MLSFYLDRGVATQFAEVRREIATKPSGTAGVTRWRSDNALHETETDSDVRQGRTVQIHTSSQSRTTINKYCPVCRKFRTRGHATTAKGNADAHAGEGFDRVSRCDYYLYILKFELSSKETSPNRRSTELHRRFSQINDDLFKLSEENRRLNEELRKLHGEKSDLETEYGNLKHLYERVGIWR